MHSTTPFIDGDFYVFPDGRRLPRLRGGEETEEEKAAREKREAEEKAKADAKKPPWGSDDEFDPEKAWKLITNLRDDLDKVKTERDDLKKTVKEHEDATKSESQKAEERATTAESSASKATQEAARLRVALKKGLSETQAKRLVGESEEDLEKDADDLLASFKDEEDGGGGEAPRRPRERLRPGAVPDAEPDENDPEKLAAKVPRPY